jgi:Aminopeptidase P, N-terminal domain
MKRTVQRISAFTERRACVANALQLTDEILVIGAGEPLPLPEGTDQTYPFRAHPEYLYLTGIDSPRGILAFDPKGRSRKRWISFVPDATEAERTWEGRVQPVGKNLALLEPWFTARHSECTARPNQALQPVSSLKLF